MTAKVTIDPAGLDAIRKQAGRLIYKIVQDVKSTILDLMREPKSGRTYWKGKDRNIAHVASAPGEAPAIDHGLLWNSITGVMARPTTGVIAVGARHGLFLELGTIRMERRPFIEPAMNQVLQKLDNAGIISRFDRIRTSDGI